jgi:hypothetical protein
MAAHARGRTRDRPRLIAPRCWQERPCPLLHRWTSPPCRPPRRHTRRAPRAMASRFRAGVDQQPRRSPPLERQPPRMDALLARPQPTLAPLRIPQANDRDRGAGRGDRPRPHRNLLGLTAADSTLSRAPTRWPPPTRRLPHPGGQLHRRLCGCRFSLPVQMPVWRFLPRAPARALGSHVRAAPGREPWRDLGRSGWMRCWRSLLDRGSVASAHRVSSLGL